MSIPEVGKKIRVIVPSTTANLGPGFDCLGAAGAVFKRSFFVSYNGTFSETRSSHPAKGT